MTTPDHDPDWLRRVAAPLWQMLTGIGQLRAGETLLVLGGDAAERAFVADAACLLGATLADAGSGPPQLALVLDSTADFESLTQAVAPCGRIVVRAGRVEGRFDAARIAARGLTVRGFDVSGWAARQPDQLRDIVAALESCRGGPTSPLVTLGGQS